jgi:rubrerythrin
MRKFELSALIAKNNIGEQDAIEGYMYLLAIPGYPEEFYADIREIISDEMNHTRKLNDWATKLSGIEPSET